MVGRANSRSTQKNAGNSRAATACITAATVDTPGGQRQDNSRSMAQLTQAEFQQAITLLADEMGLQRLRDRLVRLNAFVTRRKVASPQALADQLYLLSAGLRRQVPATYAFHAIWGEQINSRLGEEGEKNI